MKLADVKAEFSNLYRDSILEGPSVEREARKTFLAAILSIHYSTYFKKLKEGFRSFLEALPEEYDDLHTKNLIEDARALLDEAEEVTGI
ncbi:MAG: hypothetical protein WC455_09125 [Dehalococcoidia bacterium]|jgi:hypothetical protein